MAFTPDIEKFRFDDDLAKAFAERRVLITGAGRDGGIGQALGLAAAINGAEVVGVHFHSSYRDGFDLVAAINAQGVKAFALQADVTNVRDLWATRSYVVEQMGGSCGVDGREPNGSIFWFTVRRAKTDRDGKTG